MTFQKKVMVLCDVQTGAGTGTIKFTSDGGDVTAAIRLHNSPEKTYSVLLKIDERLLAYDAEISSVLSVGKTEISDRIDCLVTLDGKPYLYGSTGADKYRCFNLLDEYNGLKTAAKMPENPTETDKISNLSTDDFEPPEEYDPPVEDTAETARNLAKNDEEQQLVLDDYGGFEVKIGAHIKDNKILENGVEYDGKNFYLAVKPQLDEMFIVYPADTELNNLIPNSKWVRVKTEDDYYVVGVIFDLDEPKYICYGIPGEYAAKPPEDIKNVCDWLPIDLSAPEGRGYWLIYQSALDGQTVKK